MTVNRTTLLDLPLPVTGTESGTWGDTTNNGLTQYVDIAIAGMSNLTSANFTAGALTIETTEGDSSATNISATSAQYAGFRVTSLAANSTITVGNTGTSPARSYRLINADATYSLTFKATGQTGVTLLPGQSALVAFNGTDYVIVGTVGAGSTTDNTVPRFDGTTGKILQSSGITIDDSNNVSGVAQLNITTLDATNIEVTNIKAKDGTAAASIADSTGVISVTANPVLSGGTANGVLYLNGSKVATSGSALTFDGTNSFLGIGPGVTPTKSLTIYNPSIDTEIRLQAGTKNFYLAQRNSSGQVDYIVVDNAAQTWSVNNTEQMRLTSTGLGIGTSSPAEKLTVQKGNGGIRLDGAGTAASSVWLDYYVPNNGGVSTTSNFAGRIYAVSSGVTNFSDNSIRIAVPVGGSASPVDTLVVQGGNLGLGVTPSAWYSSFKGFDISSAGAVSGSANGTILWGNAYIDGSAVEKYKTNGYAVKYVVASDVGTHIWQIAPSGTAGNAITFTQAMTLDASGRWMLGTTSPFNAIGASIQSQSGTWAAGIHLRGPSVSNGCYFAASTSSTTTDFEIWNEQNGYLRFATNNTERARITSGGYFKASDSGAYIGSTGAYHELVSSTGSATAAVYIRNTNATSPAGIDLSYSAASPNGTGNIFLYCQDSTALRMSVRSNGGIANYQSNNVDLSDARTKKDINPAASMWNKIGALEIVTYKYNDQTHDDVNVGVIAQQVERVEPVWVDADGFGDTPEDGVPLKTVYTKDITFAAIKALQEAMARIETLEAKVSALEGTQP